MYKMSSFASRSIVRKILSNNGGGGSIRRQTTSRIASATNTTGKTGSTTSSTRTSDDDEPDPFSTSSAAARKTQEDSSYQDRHMDALLSATASRPYNAFIPKAYEMDLVLASRAKYSFDKILLLMQHGEDESQISCDDTTTSTMSMQDPPLTGTGFGQALSLSKKAAIYCNPNTGLEPELVVVSPFSRVLQTTMLAFPSSNTRNNTPWICHPALVDASGDLSNHPMEISDLQLTFPGMDYSLYDDNEKDNENGSTLESTPTPRTSTNSNTTTLLESKEQLLHQADIFVRWLQRRPERVVVVSSQSTFYQAFCLVTLDYEGNTDPFQNGEMRAVGIKF